MYGSRRCRGKQELLQWCVDKWWNELRKSKPETYVMREIRRCVIGDISETVSWEKWDGLDNVMKRSKDLRSERNYELERSQDVRGKILKRRRLRHGREIKRELVRNIMNWRDPQMRDEDNIAVDVMKPRLRREEDVTREYERRLITDIMSWRDPKMQGEGNIAEKVMKPSLRQKEDVNKNK